MKNLHAEPSQQPRVTEMKQRLRALAKQYQDTEAAAILDDIGRNKK